MSTKSSLTVTTHTILWSLFHFCQADFCPRIKDTLRPAFYQGKVNTTRSMHHRWSQTWFMSETSSTCTVNYRNSGWWFCKDLQIFVKKKTGLPILKKSFVVFQHMHSDKVSLLFDTQNREVWCASDWPGTPWVAFRTPATGRPCEANLNKHTRRRGAFLHLGAEAVT